MKFRAKIAALSTVGAAAAMVLTATPALASTAVTGPESAYGVIYGKAATANNPVIPTAWYGLVSAHGVFSTGGSAPKKGQHHTFYTSAGNLTAEVTAPPANQQSQNLKACHFWFATYVDFKIVGGTGRFAGASGSGAVEVYFAGYGPRYTSGKKKGQCNTSPSAPELAKGAVASFLLSAVMTR